MEPDHLHTTEIATCGPLCKNPTPPNLQVQAGFTDQLSAFFSGLLKTSDWPARWHCGTWSDFHGWLYIISDFLIWGAYFLIPLFLLRLVFIRRDFPFPKIIWLFGAFIVLCGTTHFIDALIFWWPVYRLSAFVRLLTAIVSMATVFVLYRILPDILSLRSVKELEHEIHERQLVEEKLAASEFLLSEAGRIGRVGGWEMDIDSNQFSWSKTVCEIYDLPEDYLIKPEDSMSYFVEPHQRVMKQAFKDAYMNGIGWDLELQIMTGAQEKKWVRYYGKPLFDCTGRLTKMRGVVMDIDKYKTNELALSRSIDLMTQQNNQLKNFTHILSHNLRNHASNISLLTSFVDETTLDPENEDIISKIKSVSNNLNQTLNDLSDVIKIRESYIPAQQLSFAQVTAKVLGVLDIALIESNAIVETDYQVDDIVFPGIYLESIIMNLVSNGIKYKQENKDVRIHLRTYLDEDNVTVFEYCDNGVGINLDLHGDKVFGLYKTFHKHKDAHGIGLFMVKNQIESQGGSIEIKSSVNVGTTFKITFHEKN